MKTNMLNKCTNLTLDVDYLWTVQDRRLNLLHTIFFQRWPPNTFLFAHTNCIFEFIVPIINRLHTWLRFFKAGLKTALY